MFPLTALLIVVLSLFLKNFFKKNSYVNLELNGDYIAHAMGEIDGVAYTNSLDAFILNYEKGCRVFEVDFDLVDGKLICCHDESIFKRFVNNQNYTYENFMHSKLLGKYTTLDLAGLSQLLRDYPDVWIITDTKYFDYETAKQMFSMIKAACADNLDRIIPQIYSKMMYQSVTVVYSFPHIIFTLYQLDHWEAEDIAFFCSVNNIPMVTMWHYLLNENIAKVFHKYQIKIGTHTVNDEAMVEKLKQIGCDYFYSDNIVI